MNQPQEVLSQILETKIDIQLRRIYLVGEIGESSAFLVESGLTLLESIDPVAPITIWICSEGGDINAGYAIIDSIISREIEINTHCFGNAFSMAAWILAVGDNRSMTAHSFAMIHEGQFSFSDETMSHTKLEQYRKFHKELERQGWKILGERTKRTAGWWKKKCESGELFLSAVKSRSLGLIDRIT